MADGHPTPGDVFVIQVAHQTRLVRAALAAARPFLSPLIGLQRLRHLYERARGTHGGTFEDRVLHALGVRVLVQPAEGANIPAAGALIVVANHPTGALDGLVLAAAVRQVRSDVRIVGNHVLGRIPELRELCFFVDPFGGPAAAARSRAGLRAAHLWLRQGGALVMFPAGEVASRIANRDSRTANDEPRTFIDSPWHPTAGRLALATGATVLPAFVDARNSTLFYLAGRVHPVLRTVLLGRELLNKRGRTVRALLGAPISLSPAGDAHVATDTMRRAVEALPASAATRPRRVEPVAEPIDPGLLEQDVRGLPAEALLLSSGEYDVYCADAESIPHLLQEIGRLREVTFRAVGEGTGRAIDLDRFDETYSHLFVWHRSARDVVGAYRIGKTHDILASHGLDGLYTRTLFRYDERMVEQMGPALELGRSFVRNEYQRSYSPLFLLWKGIGAIVARAPRYRVLFGCVSISSRYQDTSQYLLREFLARERLDLTLANLVEAINPPSPIAPPPRDAVAPVDLDELDRVISRIEGNQGMPVLLRQYLKLNATLLGFNTDPAFGDALDALMMVNLCRLPLPILQRYVGRKAAALIAAHSVAAA